MEYRRDFGSEFETSLAEREGAAVRTVGTLRSLVTVSRYDHEDSCSRPGGSEMGWVEAGVVRKYVIHANGQRRIIDLLLPGDFFGFEHEGPLECSLQAVTDGTVVARCERKRLLELAARDADVGRLLQERSHQAIVRLETHLLAQGRTRSSEKVGAYLLALAWRLGMPLRSVELPISRYDIADHLGLAVETVCRAITDLRRAGIIGFSSPRKIAILDAHRLDNDY